MKTYVDFASKLNLRFPFNHRLDNALDRYSASAYQMPTTTYVQAHLSSLHSADLSFLLSLHSGCTAALRAFRGAAISRTSAARKSTPATTQHTAARQKEAPGLPSWLKVEA